MRHCGAMRFHHTHTHTHTHTDTDTDPVQQGSCLISPSREPTSGLHQCLLRMNPSGFLRTESVPLRYKHSRRRSRRRRQIPEAGVCSYTTTLVHSGVRSIQILKYSKHHTAKVLSLMSIQYLSKCTPLLIKNFVLKMSKQLGFFFIRISGVKSSHFTALKHSAMIANILDLAG